MDTFYIKFDAGAIPTVMVVRRWSSPRMLGHRPKACSTSFEPLLKPRGLWRCNRNERVIHSPSGRMGIRSAEELRLVNRAAVVAWQNLMKERATKARTIRRRLSALSSLFVHLVAHRAADTNPVRDIKRPRVNRRQGTTRAFSAKEARQILDAPDPKTVRGLRDRAILSIGLQAGPRRSEIASLLVKDYHTDAGYKSLHFIRKGGEDLSLAINPQTAQRIEEYLAVAGHGEDADGPLFRPVRKN